MDESQLTAAGVAPAYHSQALATKALADARGINWKGVLDAFVKWGPVVFDILHDVLKEPPAPPTAPAPKP